MRWVVFSVVLAGGCGHGFGPPDDGHRFLGVRECASGSRQIDCGAGIVSRDLTLELPKYIQFVKGTTTNVELVAPSDVMVPDLGGPDCRLPFDAEQETAALVVNDSRCTDDEGKDFVVHDAIAYGGGGPMKLVINAMSGDDCSVHTDAVCYEN